MSAPTSDIHDRSLLYIVFPDDIILIFWLMRASMELIIILNYKVKL